MTTKLMENDLIENKGLREEMISKVEVLEKVKDLFLLPNTDLMTTKMVAEYFEVSQDVIRDNIRRNKDEIVHNGMKMMSYSEIKQILNSENISHLRISKQGSNIFSKRTVLNVAMLLRDSEVAKRVRTALLDQQEEMTDEQKTKGITDEQMLLLNIIQSDSVGDRAVYLSEYNNYKNRHIAELNARIKEDAPKVEAHNHFMKATNGQKVNEVAKALGIGSIKLLAFLRDNKVMMKVGNSNVPYQRYIDNQYFYVKEGTVIKNGNHINFITSYVTAKGVNGISKMLRKHGVIQ